MLERISLENFKACRDVSIRLAPLTLLAGTNSSGKSSVLQAIALLRQSYEIDSGRSGACLSGHLVQLGRFGDVRTEGGDDIVTVVTTELDKCCLWSFSGSREDSNVPFSKAPVAPPEFIRTSHFQFLQADRLVPRTLYPQAPLAAGSSGFLGPRGEYTVDFLASSGSRPSHTARTFPRSSVEAPMNTIDRVAPTSSLLDQVAGWMQQLSPGVTLRADRVSGTDEVILQFRYTGASWENKTSYYRPTNVGFGLTYSLPILVCCLSAQPGALVLLENPEAHLHPRGQSALGELLARCAADGVQVIAETHSDHVLNGVRLAVKRGLIPSSQVSTHFFTRSVETGDSNVESPSILPNGRLSNWPQGFFDQWDRDLDALLE